LPLLDVNRRVRWSFSSQKYFEGMFQRWIILRRFIFPLNYLIISDVPKERQNFLFCVLGYSID